MHKLEPQRSRFNQVLIYQVDNYFIWVPTPLGGRTEHLAGLSPLRSGFQSPCFRTKTPHQLCIYEDLCLRYSAVLNDDTLLFRGHPGLQNGHHRLTNSQKDTRQRSLSVNDMPSVSE